jgi:hypothetical protein
MSRKMSSTSAAHFSVAKVLANLFALMAFAVLFGVGVNTIATNPKVGWFATILFGTMSVAAVIEIIRVCGLDQDQIPDVKAQLGIRQSLVYSGALLVTLFLGLADHFISNSFSHSFPRPGIWLGTFLTTLAFYPLREQKGDFPNFTIWTLYCALMGVASVVISYLKDWVQQIV